MLNISQKEKDGVSILSVYGRVDHASSSDFEQTLLSAVQRGHKFIILDFSNFNYISSSGLRSLLLISKTLKQNNGMLVLSMIPPHIYEVLETSGLHSIFNLCDSVEDGLNMFCKVKDPLLSA